MPYKANAACVNAKRYKIKQTKAAEYVKSSPASFPKLEPESGAAQVTIRSARNWEAMPSWSRNAASAAGILNTPIARRTRRVARSRDILVETVEAAVFGKSK